ncbi:thiamine biosynthesis protein ThiF [Thalassiella azotivora]
MGLRLRPGLATAWRAPGRLQVGLDADAVLLDGLSPDDERVLDLLDGASGPAELLRRAGRAGVDVGRARSLLLRLESAGVLAGGRVAHDLGVGPRDVGAGTAPGAVPDRDLDAVRSDRARPRSSATVAVAGLCPTGLTVASWLAHAGAGTVVLDDDRPVRAADVGPCGYRPRDVGSPRARAARARVSRSAPRTRTAVGGDVRPDLVVLVAHGALDPALTEGLAREDVPHLPLVLRERVAVAGPLVLPGRSTCCRCVDLARADRDPEWPRVVDQLARGGRSGHGHLTTGYALRGPAGARWADADPALVAPAAGLAVAQALAHLDGRDVPATVGATLEVVLPDGLVGVRPWAPHPACGCTWRSLAGPPGTSREVTGQAAGRASPRPAATLTAAPRARPTRPGEPVPSRVPAASVDTMGG